MKEGLSHAGKGKGQCLPLIAGRFRDSNRVQKVSSILFGASLPHLSLDYAWSLNPMGWQGMWLCCHWLGLAFPPELYSNAHVGEHLLGRAISTRRSSCVAVTYWCHLRSYFFSFFLLISVRRKTCMLLLPLSCLNSPCPLLPNFLTIEAESATAATAAADGQTAAYTVLKAALSATPQLNLTLLIQLLASLSSPILLSRLLKNQHSTYF